MELKRKTRFVYLVISLLALLGCATVEEKIHKKGAKEVAQQPTPYYGPKKRVAVIRFENKVSNQWWDKSWEIGNGLAEMLTTELFNTGRFIVIERAAITDVVKEQELGQTGLVQEATAAKTGLVLGAQILVIGAVTEFKYDASGGSGGLSFSGVNLGLSGKQAHVAIDLRMVEANTGQVIEAYRATGKATSMGLALSTDISRGVRFGGDVFNKTPIGKATRAAIDDAIRFVLLKSEPIPWSGAVVKVDGNKIIINAGAKSNIKSGESMVVFSKGETLIDPTTGLSLGSTLTRVGEVQIELVEDQFSIAHIVNGSHMKRGDLVKYTCDTRLC